MHVLVTGATGFIGFHTVMALLEAGHTVRLGVRNRDKMERLYGPLGVDTSDYVASEITDKAAIDRALEGCDGVVHTAAMVSLDRNRAQEIYHTNVTGTQLVVGGAVAQGIEAIVYVSSVASLYDPRAELLDESLPLAGQDSPYGRSKADSDAYVRSQVEQGATIALTYPSGVVGPIDPAMSEGNQGLAIFFNQGFFNTSSGVQLIDVRELARVHVAMLERQMSGPYLVTGHYRSWEELGRLLDRITGRRLTKYPAPGWMVRGIGSLADLVGRFVTNNTPVTAEGALYATRWIYADDRKVRRELDLRYRPLEETLADTVAWLAQAGHIDRWWAENLPATLTAAPGRRE